MSTMGVAKLLIKLPEVGSEWQMSNLYDILIHRKMSQQLLARLIFTVSDGWMNPRQFGDPLHF